tara:strand:- start:315 stop:770 length:456 start_codon:yes stop_codon:yes gene_type:complete
MSETTFRVRSGGRVFGPFSLQRISELIAGGRIDNVAMVCEEGHDQWVPLSTVLGSGEDVPGDELVDDPDVITVHEEDWWETEDLDVLEFEEGELADVETAVVDDRPEEEVVLGMPKRDFHRVLLVVGLGCGGMLFVVVGVVGLFLFLGSAW